MSLTNEKFNVIGKPLEKEQIENLCNEVATEIVENIINGYRANYGENDTWNELISFLQPDDISTLLKQNIFVICNIT